MRLDEALLAEDQLNRDNSQVGMIAPAQFAERDADLGLVTEDQARRLWSNRTRRIALEGH